MIEFNYETDFNLEDESLLKDWICTVASEQNFEVGEINYIFCNDSYLHKLNVEFLDHDTLTDIISFDNSLGKLLNGDIFISVERVKDNAVDFNVSFQDELYRVMIHGVLHYMGYKDKSIDEKKMMRNQEDLALCKLSN
ncbi:MAG: rRNA maturation RNase YbeY [Polaribacter sp.]|jgi:probable rRNA maturation factor